MSVGGLSRRFRRWLRGGLPTWYDPAYRPPSVTLESGRGLEPRRADLVAWHLADLGLLSRSELRHPPRATWAQLCRVHEPAYLDSLQDRDRLAALLGLPAWDTPADELLLSARLAVGGTLDATREALRRGGPTLNLAGGDHHARPDGGAHGGLLSDVAVAAAEARAMGFTEPIQVLDLDAHPPSGLAACLRGLPGIWIGSVSEAGWGEPAGVDEVQVPRGSGDEAWLRALQELLARRPEAGLTYVIAGGDLLEGDRRGHLALTEAGLRQRDLRVAEALAGAPAVWLPGGGYHPRAWRVLAGTAMALAARSDEPIPEDAQPMRRRFALIFEKLDPAALGDELGGMGLDGGGPRWLDYYSAEGLLRAFHEYGIIDHLRRLGYSRFAVRLEPGREDGDAMRLFGLGGGDEHLLIECVASRERLGDDWMLYINWLTLRHPLASFDRGRPQLPGQRVPGLGLGPEITEMLGLVARRLGLAGVWFRPAHFHVAWSGRRLWRFADPARQGRFEAMLRDLGHLPLRDLTRAVAEGRARLNGQPYAWEADDMLFRAPTDAPSPAWRAAADAAREASRFTLDPP